MWEGKGSEVQRKSRKGDVDSGAGRVWPIAMVRDVAKSVKPGKPGDALGREAFCKTPKL